MAEYNCATSDNSAYGAGSYGTCTGQDQSVGAPNTGFFQELSHSGSLTILLPLLFIIVVVVFATIVKKLRNRKSHR